MSDSPTPVPDPTPSQAGTERTRAVPDPSPTPAPKKKKKHLWLKVVGVLIILLIALVLLAPTIASLSPVRGIVVGQVNNNLNGTVSIGDYSVGWLGGINASDVKVFDKAGTLILQLNQLKTSLTLLDLVKGNYALGDTTVDVDLTKAVVDSNGKLNYQDLAKPSPAKPEKEKTAEPKATTSEPTKVPNVSGKITLKYKGAVFVAGNDKAVMQIQPSQAVIDITDINQPISDDVTLMYSAADGPVGTIHIAGHASAVKNNVVDTANMTADQATDLSAVDLKALTAVVKIFAPTMQLEPAGTASGSLAVNLNGTNDIAAKGKISVAQFTASGAPLAAGDQVNIKSIDVPVDVSQKTADGKQMMNANVAVLLNNGDLGKVTIVANGPMDTLLGASKLVPAVLAKALSGTEPPKDSLTLTGDGSAKLNVDLDLAALIDQVKNTVALQKGMSLSQGHLSHQTTITLASNSVKVDSDTKLPDLTGTNAGKTVKLSPIDVAAGMSAVGGDAPDLHDLSVKFDSGFMNASGGGPSLSQEKITGGFDLAKLQAEAQQFVDLDAIANPPATQPSTQPVAPHTPLNLVGAGSFDLSTSGDLLKTGGTGKVAADLTIAGLDASGIGAAPPLKVTTITGTLGGDLTRGEKTVSYKNLAAALTAAGITVNNKTTSQPILNNETVKVAATLTSSADGNGLSGEGSLDSRFMTAKLSNLVAQLNGSVWDKLQKADVEIHVPDLPTVDSLMNAFSTPAATAMVDQRLATMLADADPAGVQLALADDTAPPAESAHDAAVRRKREKAAKEAKKAAAVAPAATAPADEPLPPLEVTSGSADVSLSVARDAKAQTTSLNITDASMSNLAIKRGDQKYAFARPIDFKLAAALKAADDPAKPAIMDQIQQLDVTQLAGDLVVAKLSMPDAISITSPGDPQKVSAKGSVKIDGTLGDATPLLAVYQNAKPLPYAGTYTATQLLSTGTADQGKLIRLDGTAGVSDFQELGDDGKPAFTEKQIDVKNNLDYVMGQTDPTTQKRAVDQAIVRTFSINMSSSQAMAISFVGRVVDPMDKREFRGIGSDPTAKLDATYDLKKLWPIIYPTLSPEMQTKYKDLKIEGQKHETFAISGYYPKAGKSYESMSHLNADGALAFDLLDLPQGLTITAFNWPFTMKAGVLTTAAGANQPTTQLAGTTQAVVAKTAICNDGAVDLSEITLDLGKPSPVLTVAKDHKLLQNVKLNPVLADSLGSANLLFKDASSATGLINMTIIQCNQVPLGELMAKATKADAQATYSISDLAIDGPVPSAMSSGLQLGGQGLHGTLQDGSLTLAEGVATNSFTFNVIRYKKVKSNGKVDNNDPGTDSSTDTSGMKAVNLPIKFHGGVNLSTEALIDFAVDITPGLLAGVNKNAAEALPNGLTVPITGTVSHAKFDIGKALIQNGGANLLGGLLNKKKKGDDS